MDAYVFVMRIIGVTLVVFALTVGAGLRFDSLWSFALGVGLMLLGTNSNKSKGK